MRDKAEEKINGYFFLEFGALFPEDSPVKNFIRTNAVTLAMTVKLKYAGLELIDYTADLDEEEMAELAYAEIGESILKIYSVMVKNYDPMENFFTHREYESHSGGSITKTGKETTQPSGTVSVSSTGNKEHEYMNRTDIGYSTTYDNTNDWRKTNEHVISGSEKDKFNSFGTNTTYQNYKVDTTFDNRKDETKANSHGHEDKNGNSGIFSKQDLLTRELKVRFRYRMCDILTRMIIDFFNCGVWSE